MLHLLLELLVSVVLCGALAYFAFLNSPVEVEEPGTAAAAGEADDGGIGSADAAGLGGAAATQLDGAAGLGDGLDDAGHALDPFLLQPHELPLYALLSKHVSLAEDTTAGTAYRWLLIKALHYSPREVYGERRLREWWGTRGGAAHAGTSGDGETEGGGGSGRGAAGASHAARRSRRRLRRGPTAAAAAAPTPLRKESAHWANVLLRCAAFLCLGGGTVRPEVWMDRLLYTAERVSDKVNAAYDAKMRARAAQVRGIAAQLASNSSSTGNAASAPQPPSNVHGYRAPSPSAAPSLLQPRRPLLRVQTLELGTGLLGRPPRDLRRPPLPTHAGSFAGDATGGTGLGGALRPGAAVSDAADRSLPVSGGALPHHHHSRSGGSGSGSNGSPPPAQPPQPQPQQQQQPSQPQPYVHTALDAASTLLSSSVAGLTTALADAVSSVTTSGGARGGGGGSGMSADLHPSAGGHLSDGAASVNAATAAGGETGWSAAPPVGHYSGAGAQLGVVLPRVEGDVISVEQPYRRSAPALPPRPGVSSTLSAPPASSSSTGVSRSASPRLGAASPPPLSATAAPTRRSGPGALPLRCFTVPLLYEDQRFHLRLGCCLPLGALLPVALCVPADVLTLDCAVAVRRLIFHGHLYAAFHGARVELCFPAPPLFTAVVEVAPDSSSSRGGGGGGAGGGTSGGAASLPHVGGGMAGSAGLSTFTATYTTRNEAGPIGGFYGPRPPLPPHLRTSAVPYHHHYHPAATASMHSMHGISLGGSAGVPASASSVHERNEKVQEVVLLAVQRLVDSLTYPNVLAGELVCRGGTSLGKQLHMTWSRRTATLPLRV